MNRLIVCIPTYNEKENIEDIIHSILSLSPSFNILIIDDGSPDGTADIVKNLFETYPNKLFIQERANKQGLGTAYIHGFKWAIKNRYDFIFEMDADFSHNPDDLPRLYQACKNGVDVCVGSRYVRGVNVVNWPMSRVILSFLASKYVRLITGLPIHDTTAGFKCYRKQVLKTINLDEIQFIGYAFQIEMKFKAWKHGFNIKEIDIIFTDRTKGQSKMSGGIITEAVLGVIWMKCKSFFANFKKVN